MASAYIYEALRTPRGKARADGGLAGLSPHELVRQLAEGLDARVPQARAQAGALILGCVGQVNAQGANIALVSKLHADLPDAAAAFTINNFCVSGLTAIGTAAGMVATGVATGVLAGGVEMMSKVPFQADNGDYRRDASFPPRTRYVPVALAADRLATRMGVTRAEMDEAALRSHARAAAAEEAAPLRKSRIEMRGAALDRDECVRPQTTLETLAGLEPAFAALAETYAEALGPERFQPRHTVSHAPPVCDGAGLALVAGPGREGPAPRARILAYAEAGGDPQASLTASFAAMDKALARVGLTLQDMDRVEFMEAFAVSIVTFLRDRDIDPERVNVAGGHLARGHPMGASGAILLSTLLDNLDAADGRLGLVAAAGASGVGAAMIVERLA